MKPTQSSLIIKKLELANFRAFAQATFNFHPRLNVLIGINGAGKTSILECIARMMEVYLSIMAYRTASNIEWATLFQSKDLRNGALDGACAISAEVSFNELIFDEHEEGDTAIPYEENERHDEIYWRLKLNRKGFELSGEGNELSALEDMAVQIQLRYQDALKQDQIPLLNLPIVAYYPSNIALDTNFDIKEKENWQTQDIFEANQNALNGNAFDYHAFFRWFRWQQSKPRTDAEELIFSEVKNAALSVLNGPSDSIYKQLHVDWNDSINGELALFKAGVKLKLAQLSEGEKRLLLLTANLAYRLTLANPGSQNPVQEGQGVVIIDEIDLHLHPQWELRIVPNLHTTFPNLQFIISTHSEEVLHNVDRESIFYLQNGALLDQALNPYTKGRSFEEIGQDAFGLPMYPEHTSELYALQEKIRRSYDILDEDDLSEGQLQEVEELLQEIKAVKGPKDKDVQRLYHILELVKP